MEQRNLARSEPRFAHAVLDATTVIAVALALTIGLLTTAQARPAAIQEVAGVPGGRTAIGDSVMQGAKPNLRNRGFHVNTAVSRQVADGVELLRRQKSRSNLRRTVVVHLGTNGTFAFRQCAAMHRIAGPHRNLFVVTVKVPRSWAAPNNRAISRCARRFGNTHLIDWQRFAVNNRWATYSDGYHLTPRGARAYAKLIDRRVSR